MLAEGRRGRPPANRLSRVAALALAAGLAVGITTVSAGPAAWAIGAAETGSLRTASLDALAAAGPAHSAATPAVSVNLALADAGDLGAGQPMHAVVTVNNPTATSTVAATATIAVDPTAFTSRAALADWFSGASKSAVATETVASAPVPAVGNAQSGSIAVTAAASVLPFATAGVYGVYVTVSDGSTVLGSARSAVAWNAGSAAVVPVAIAVPLTVPASTSTLLTAAQLTEYTAVDGILTRELDSVEGTDIAVGIDPRIIASIRILGKTAPTTATSWLDSLRQLPNETFPLAWADADLTAPLHAGATAVLATKSLQYAINPSLFPATTNSTPAPTPTSGDSGSTVPTSASLVQWSYTMPALEWPAENSVEPSDLPALNSAGITSAIVTSANVDNPSGSGLAGASAKSGSTTLAVSDDVLSGYLRAAAAAPDRSSSMQPLTELTTTLALMGLEAGSSPHAVLLTLGRNWASAATSLSRGLNDLYGRSWTTPVDLSDVFRATPAKVTLDKDTEPASRVALVAQLLDAESRIVRFSSIAATPTTITSSYRLQLLSLLSNGWTAAPTAWATAAHAFVTQCTKVVGSVQVSKSDRLLLLSDQTALPISITNGLDQDVTVDLAVRPSTLQLSIDRKDRFQTITIPANSEKRVEIPLQALSNGKAKLLVTLTSASGLAVGNPVTLNVTVQAGWETLGTLIFVALIVALFAFGVVRNIRKRRRQSAADNAAAEPAHASAAPAAAVDPAAGHDE